MQVAIVGGGLAGLVAAYELEKRGLSVHLLETADVLGGRVQTAGYGGGLHGEFGMQEIWESNPLKGIAEELRVPLDSGEAAFSSVVLNGKLFPNTYKTSRDYFAALFAPEERRVLDAWMRKAKRLYAIARERGAIAPEVADLQNITFQQWLEQEKLPPKVATWIRLTLECELASDWSDFSALVGLLEFHVFLDGGQRDYHVRGGNSRVIEALAKAIHGEKSLSATATAIEQSTTGKLHVRVTYTQKNQIHVLEAERVVVAIPFVRLHQLQFEPPLPEDYWQSVYTLKLGQYVVVHFLFAKEGRKLFQEDPADLFTVLTNGPLGVIYGLVDESPKDQSVDVFSLLIYGTPARVFHMAPRDMKRKELLGELNRLWPGFSQYVRATHIYSYHPAAIPVWPPGRSPVDAQAELLRKPHLGLWLAGDYTENAHSDGAVRSGIRVAKAIAEDLTSRR